MLIDDQKKLMMTITKEREKENDPKQILKTVFGHFGYSEVNTDNRQHHSTMIRVQDNKQTALT